MAHGFVLRWVDGKCSLRDGAAAVIAKARAEGPSSVAAELAEAKRRIAELESNNERVLLALYEFGHHLSYCGLRLHPYANCSCGFSAAVTAQKGGAA
jgi:hypothetical protein